jgi:hypothetical protein
MLIGLAFMHKPSFQLLVFAVGFILAVSPFLLSV